MTRSEKSRPRTTMWIVVVILLFLALLGGGYALFSGNDDNDSAATSVAGVAGLKPGVPTILSVGELKDLAADHGTVYWAGERPNTQIEVTVTTDGGTYVRYLPKGVPAGSKDEFLTIGTYSAVDGYSALSAAKKSQADVETSQSGAVIATFKSAPDSTYFAFPKTSFQVEVYSPVKGEARQLTESGSIGIVPGK